jgi:hypothetical protein
MTFKFKSQATQDLVMLQASAQQVLQLIGKDAAGSGILEPQDMPAALATLRDLPEPGGQDDEGALRGQDEDAVEPAPSEGISLRKRAWPFVQMIERAHAANKPIVWGV